MPNKDYLLPVFNEATGKFETVRLSIEQYNAVRRSEWNIEARDKKFHRKVIFLSELIIGSNYGEESGDACEYFHEFGDITYEPQTILDRLQALDALAGALLGLTENELALILALIVQEKTEWEYAKELGINQSVINRKKARILKMLRSKLDALETF